MLSQTKEVKTREWVRGSRVPPDPLVNQKVGRVNPGLHRPHSAAPQRWSDKHEYEEDSPLTWWQCSAPGLTPQVTTGLARQLYCGREMEREAGKAIKISPFHTPNPQNCWVCWSLRAFGLFNLEKSSILVWYLAFCIQGKETYDVQGERLFSATCDYDIYLSSLVAVSLWSQIYFKII